MQKLCAAFAASTEDKFQRVRAFATSTLLLQTAEGTCCFRLFKPSNSQLAMKIGDR
jgi:hypothetical protein